MLTHASPDVFAQLCRTGAVVLFIYRELGGGGQEHEAGIVTREDHDHYEVKWQCLSSTSGCRGLQFDDWYTRGKRPGLRWKHLSQRADKIFDSVEDNHDLTWSSVPIAR